MNKKELCLVVILTSVVFAVCGFNGSTGEEIEPLVTQTVTNVSPLEINVDKSMTHKLPSTQIPNQNVSFLISGLVTDVFSGNKIGVVVDGNSYEIVYHGVLIPQDDEINSVRAKELNKSW